VSRPRKSAAQVLFERLIVTWILPEANRRRAQNPQNGRIALRVALLAGTSRTDRASSAIDRATATEKARRHLRLPTLIIHQEDEFLPLLLEARQTYIDGHFFSCVAAAVTTADRICIRLMHRFNLPAAEQRQMLTRTFGQKIQPLRARGIITVQQEALLNKMNRIRTRHLHPRTAPSAMTTKRDALAAVQLLHELLEGTFSVFRDYEISNGSFVPKPIV
jgi:hypothetical protein